MVHDDRARAESFGQRAEQYHQVRPRYPEALWDLLLPRPGLTVLDVGCGTGIAALAMAERGAEVLGIDVDEQMAAVARRQGLAVEVSSFEEWDPRGRTFERVTAAQSWHWVQPERGVAQAARCLVPGGQLCLFWNVGRPLGEVRHALDALYARVLGPESYSGYASGFHHERTAEDLRDVEGFEPLPMETLEWQGHYTAAEWVNLLPTHSDHARLDPTIREELLEEVGGIIDAFGGSLVVGYSTILLRWRRRGELE